MRTLRQLDPKGKRVLVRVDYNVPIENGVVQDETRIQESLPTLRHLLAGGASLVLLSHLGRPKGPDPKYSLAPVAEALARHLPGARFVPHSPGSEEAYQAVRSLGPGEVALLENVRFEPGEEKNDPELAARYARLGDAFVLDAFGSAHRAHASVVGVARLLPAYAGFLMEKEVRALSRLLHEPERPYAVVLGGAKVSDKIGVIESLLPRIDRLLIGGAMAFTFLKALGGEVGKSLVEEDRLDLARDLLKRAEGLGVRVYLPQDVVAATEIAAGVETRVFPADAIPVPYMGLDIGPKTQEAFAEALKGMRTVFWNGPMGVFEVPPFDQGTLGVGRAIAALEGAFTVVGGGDSVAAVNRLGLKERFGHVSTGGGASLEYLEKGTLPGIEVLE
ncbi:MULTISPECIES: phosphoglycerate kinase [Thermus]|jgi:phosphoglycerate kinase|uniref:Phosphoglycerate kinase n=1 Tax=Thermus brockianus TaxID=56956 RepID=A0A1J0LXQ4_THEBO|nr:phosphoglycerate kinase [Thermus brockianus]APD10247.1 phosphoglycerate kinase [Thermus brockianus]BDG16472.1 phosphoglycerate kinase [Thermus brockianus]